MVKKKKKKHDNIVLLAKAKLNRIEVLIELNITHDEFALINNVLKEYNKMKEEIKSLKNWSSLVHLQNNKQFYHIAWTVEKIQKVKIQKFQGQKTEE